METSSEGVKPKLLTDRYCETANEKKGADDLAVVLDPGGNELHLTYQMGSCGTETEKERQEIGPTSARSGA
jgi:hypothetical protein